MNDDDPISAYKAAAKAHGAATQAGDADTANRAYDELQVLLNKVISSNREHELQGLLDDDDVWVQLWAGAHTLEIDEETAAAHLQVIVDAAIPLASMIARYTLQEWKSGDLRFRD